MSVELPRYRVLSHKTILLWAVAIAATGAGLAVWLLLAYGQEDPLGAIRTAGTVVVGSGGGAALLLAARRQRSAEIALLQKERDQADVARTHALQETIAAESRADAAERRITDLYTKAVEQLGSDKAPVRLGGLYALERLAQDNEHQRQTIVNVLCAYLRMPYPRQDAEAVDDTSHLEEREVRLTAQSLLTRHTRAGSREFWPDMDLNLTGALLVDFTMIECALRWATFKGATFTGTTMFLNMSFPDYTNFTEAVFTGETHFSGTTFTGEARFEDATFQDFVQFSGYLEAHNVRFARQATFKGVTFGGRASFSGATFDGWAYFGNSRSGRPTSFTGEADFWGTHFKSNANFRDTTFNGPANFTKVRFDAKKSEGFPTLEPTTDFRSATFAQAVPPEVAPFLTDEGWPVPPVRRQP